MRDGLLGWLARAPATFEFVPAVRAALAWARSRGGATGGRSRAGERVRFRGSLSFVFPVGPVEEVEVDRERGRVTLVTHVGSLTGGTGALPRFYTQLVRERLRRGDRALREFLDIFSNRWAWFAYRVLEKYAVGPLGDEVHGAGVTDRLVFFLGRGGERARQERLLHAGDLLPYVGLWTQRPRSAIALEQVLGHFLGGESVEVRQFRGRWATIPAEERAAVGVARLDGSSAIGSRMWDRQGGIEVRVGPLALEKFRELQPGGRLLPRVTALVREYLGDRLLVRLVALLRGREIPECRLPAADEADGPRLGEDLCLGGPGCCDVMVGQALEI